MVIFQNNNYKYYVNHGHNVSCVNVSNWCPIRLYFQTYSFALKQHKENKCCI